MSVRPVSDAALVRRVRWRLLAWSGGSTLAVLVLLGSLIYVAVANSLNPIPSCNILMHYIFCNCSIASLSAIWVTNNIRRKYNYR